MDQKIEKPAACATTLTGFEVSSLAASENSDSATPSSKRQAPATSQARWKEANQKAVWAHSCLAAAIRRGLVKRQPCKVCGDPKSDGHHPDYEKPAAVIWLCRLHHKRAHRRALHPKKQGGAK
ncbi:hypothetical protein [Mesorhizobium sp. LNJC405B00]|uniref:hypothetical protein n=1 Tax=unclassified Mesorhizobium TaxID=325217 RepID=UPI0003CE81FD|nr:hypothetical protein [Mesorhizobium sp. LNJC405B00]ESX98661.1 hypothetical protein X755_15565 [Mesorhizobium sp. LNJC405B00]